MLASAAGAFSAYLYTKLAFGRPDLSMLCNGMLAGLVAITAPCAFVGALASIFIGAVAGVLVIVSAIFIETRLRIDDPVGASSVHGVCGAWGVLSLGLLADGTYGDGTNGVAGNVTGLFYGDASQLAAQLVGITTNIIWVGLTGYAAWKITAKLTDGHRVSTAIEELGLDLPEMGALAYPDHVDLSSAVVMQTESSTPLKRAS
jgi:Amt family ammonium transporter